MFLHFFIMKKYVSYLRVSTKEQQRSGLGIEAQRAIIKHYIDMEQAEIVQEYIEPESGKSIENRPLLQQAIAQCKQHKYILVVAKLDRLSRDVEHIFRLLTYLRCLFLQDWHREKERLSV
jgi:DNA invertase Pin-like site-specific DNA recombinase